MRAHVVVRCASFGGIRTCKRRSWTLYGPSATAPCVIAWQPHARRCARVGASPMLSGRVPRRQRHPRA
jgi:hypothetical protein